MRSSRWVGFLGIAVAAMSASGQYNQEWRKAPAIAGSVVGHLTFSDTHLPARFAEIILVHKPSPEDLIYDHAPNAPTSVVSVSGRSGFDGSFTVPDVPPGDWFAIAKMPGCIIPIRRASSESDAKDFSKMTADLQVVHVEANRASGIDIELQRGGAIAGRILFQDGTPVAGLPVTIDPDRSEVRLDETGYGPLTSAIRPSVMPGGRGSGVMTDDQGRYRVSGLRPGKYQISIDLSTSGGQRAVGNARGTSSGPVANGGDTRLTIFLPGTVRRSQAKPVEVKGTQLVGDADFSVDLSGLHTVSGRVLAQSDGHAPNVTSITLTDDSTGDAYRSATNTPESGFRFEYIPPGTYTLAVQHAEDLEEPPSPHPGAQSDRHAGAAEVELKPRRSYVGRKLPVMIGSQDVLLDSIMLDAVQAKDGSGTP